LIAINNRLLICVLATLNMGKVFAMKSYAAHDAKRFLS